MNAFISSQFSYYPLKYGCVTADPFMHVLTGFTRARIVYNDNNSSFDELFVKSGSVKIRL